MEIASPASDESGRVEIEPAKGFFESKILVVSTSLLIAVLVAGGIVLLRKGAQKASDGPEVPVLLYQQQNGPIPEEVLQDLPAVVREAIEAEQEKK